MAVSAQDACAGAEQGDVDKALGVPPGLRRVLPQPCPERRAERVSVCVARCRSSQQAVEAAARSLRWELVSRDTPEVSVAWLEGVEPCPRFSPFQVVSKIDGVHEVCHKANLTACLQAMQEHFPDDYAFFPPTWILSPGCPEQAVDLEAAMAESKGWTYICKPSNGSQGRGLRLVRGFSELRGPIRDTRAAPRGRTAEFVVQRYVCRPLLVGGYKFDCRCYIVLTGVVPLRGYLFREGLARFCTTKYEKPRDRNVSNMCMHLTNYAVNKRSNAFGTDAAHDAGSKRSLSSVFQSIADRGGPSVDELWAQVQLVAERTLLAVRPALVERVLRRGEAGPGLHPSGPKAVHILGFDVIFDEEYKPFLLEVNSASSLSVLQPSFDCGSPRREEVCELDLVVKAELLAQALLVAGPLPHGQALRGRLAWLEARASAPAAMEPIPLDDDGVPVNGGPLPEPTLVDRPADCPALHPLDFQRHAAMSLVRAHLEEQRALSQRDAEGQGG